MIGAIADIATAIAAFLAFVAILLARAQLKAQSEATALGIYHRYLNLAMEHPRFAQPNYKELSAHRGSELFTQYEWFVSSMLYACEAVLVVFPKREDWMEGITAQLRYHCEYLSSKDFVLVREHWNDQLLALVDQVIAE
jgi:hypothetical protein